MEIGNLKRVITFNYAVFNTDQLLDGAPANYISNAVAIPVNNIELVRNEILTKVVLRSSFYFPFEGGAGTSGNVDSIKTVPDAVNDKYPFLNYFQQNILVLNTRLQLGQLNEKHYLTGYDEIGNFGLTEILAANISMTDAKTYTDSSSPHKFAEFELNIYNASRAAKSPLLNFSLFSSVYPKSDDENNNLPYPLAANDHDRQLSSLNTVYIYIHEFKQ